MNRQIGVALLAHWGIEPLIARDGAEAVRIATQQRLDLILMDIAMPVMDGLAATALIRRFEREHGVATPVPVVAYTSNERTGDDALRLGIDEVLRKPADLTAMGECLQRWCTGARAAN